MPIIALPAHYNGERICLDEPFELKADTKLIVTILPEHKPDEEQFSWSFLSAQKLQYAYGENEPEYPLSLLKEVNPDYEGR